MLKFQKLEHSPPKKKKKMEFIIITHWSLDIKIII